MTYEINTEKIKEITAYLMSSFDKDNQLGEIATMHTGVLASDKLGILTKGGFENVEVSTGCGPEFDDIDMSVKYPWTLGDYSLNLGFCAKDIDPELRRAKKLYDLTDDTEVFSQWLTSFLEKSFTESIFARAIFGSKTSAVKGLSGTTDGAIAQAEAMIVDGTAQASQKVAITTNTMSALRNGTTALDVLFEVTSNFTDDMKDGGAYILIGKNFYSDLAYCARMCNAGHSFNSEQYKEIGNGWATDVFDGVTLVISPIVDKVLAKIDGNLQGKRAVIFASTVNDLHIGTIQDVENQPETEIWYEKKDKKVYGTLDYNAGVILTPNFVIAY